MIRPGLDDFLKDWRPVFGIKNPDPVDSVFCRWMIRRALDKTEDSSACAFTAVKELGLDEEYGSFKGYAPVWCFERFGKTITPLPDGRNIHIAGEHEDHYDPDFCIYNDVMIEQPGGDTLLYRYPEADFPPTDFHTATLVGDRIIIIGNLGYPGHRRPDTTPVYVLSTDGLTVRKLPTEGEIPGWIHKHEASASRDGSYIMVSKGERAVFNDTGGHILAPNFDAYELDTRNGIWKKLTDRSDWSCFEIASDEWTHLLKLPVEEIIRLKSPGYACGALSVSLLFSNESDDEPQRPHRLIHERLHIRITEGFMGACTVVFEGVAEESFRREYLEYLRLTASEAFGITFKITRLV